MPRSPLSFRIAHRLLRQFLEVVGKHSEAIAAYWTTSNLAVYCVSNTSVVEALSMAVPGKLEITIKISEFPTDVRTVENNWKSFDIDTGDGRIVSVTVKPKVFKKLEDARDNFPQ